MPFMSHSMMPDAPKPPRARAHKRGVVAVDRGYVVERHGALQGVATGFLVRKSTQSPVSATRGSIEQCSGGRHPRLIGDQPGGGRAARATRTPPTRRARRRASARSAGARAATASLELEWRGSPKILGGGPANAPPRRSAQPARSAPPLAEAACTPRSPARVPRSAAAASSASFTPIRRGARGIEQEKVAEPLAAAAASGSPFDDSVWLAACQNANCAFTAACSVFTAGSRSRRTSGSGAADRGIGTSAGWR